MRQQEYLTESKPGVPTGFPTLDKVTNGAMPGCLYLIAAGTGEGKSVMLLNIAHNMWTAGKKVLFISVENYYDDVMRRFTSRDAEVFESDLKRGVLNPDQRRRLAESIARQKAGSKRLRVESRTSNCTPAYVEQKINDMFPEKFDAVFVDYLQIMDLQVKNSRQDARDQYFGDLAKELRRVAKEKHVPIFTAVQVNREGLKTKDESYSVAHIALSQQIANHSDLVLSIRALTPTKERVRGTVQMEASCAKNRNGAPGRFGISANFSVMQMVEQTMGVV